MDLTSALPIIHNYLVPSLIGVGSYLISSWVKLKNLAFKSKSQEQTFLDKEWERLNAIREYIDKKMESVIKENDLLRERIEHLETEVDQLRTENLLLKAQMKAGK